MQTGEFSTDSFLAIYNHVGASKEDDDRFLKLTFLRYAEQAWDDKGQPLKDTKVLSKKSAEKFSRDVLSNWKKLTSEENESYLQQNFESIFEKQNM